MKTETKQKLVKCIDKLQNQIKGGPGSGPRPGGGSMQPLGGSVGGRIQTGPLGKPTASVFYQHDTTLGGNPTSRSVLLGDHIKINGHSGNLIHIDPNGGHLVVRNRETGQHHTVALKE